MKTPGKDGMTRAGLRWASFIAAILLAGACSDKGGLPAPPGASSETEEKSADNKVTARTADTAPVNPPAATLSLIHI